MDRILIFAGTIEGRTIAEYLDSFGVNTRVCVATEYGESLISATPHMEVSHDRLDEGAMKALMAAEHFSFVLDATHPYAAQVTENIRKAAEAAGLSYVRLLRKSEDFDREDVVFVDSVDEACDYLADTTGSILSTTGSKELAKYTRIPDYRNRVYARVLSLPQVVADCAALGFEGKHLICMQGPFSLEMNTAMLKQYDIQWLVTKETGNAGGFHEKVEAARRAGARLIVIGRPLQEEGLSLQECKVWLAKKLSLPSRKKVSLVAIGPGAALGLTLEAHQAFREADLIIGARRMADSVAAKGQEVYYAYKPEEIKAVINGRPGDENIAIALSGDVGFYSGAKRLIQVLEREVSIIPGVSSMVAFCARLGIPWEDVRPFSVHGREVNLIGHLKKEEKVFAILGTRDGVAKLAGSLTAYGMGDIYMAVGERLSYPDERITKGLAKDLTTLECDPLCVVYLENKKAREHVVTHGLSDECFLRDKVPMTKEEVRTASISKLHLKRDSVIYDVGAGTGSVSIEMALTVTDGHVYAIEKKDTAVELLKKNKALFACDNMTIVEGLAPDCMHELPVPTHAFIGGSSGNLDQIVGLLLSKNPRIRLVINAITLETVQEVLEVMKKYPVTDTEIVSMTVARSKAVGSYHLMMGQNPVYIFSFEGV